MIRPSEAPASGHGSSVSRLAILGVGLVCVALALVACGGSATTPASPTPSDASPASSAGPGASATTPVAGNFADLPFTLTLPDGWVFGSGHDIAAGLATLEKTDPARAGKLQALLARSPSLTSEFVAFDVGSDEESTPSVSCNTLDRGNLSPADALAQGQAQNVDAISRLPGIVGTPTADRVDVPVGETVRVRWRVRDAATGADTSWIGYLFVAGPTVYTCVFSAGTSTIATHEPAWEAILRTFEAKPSTSASAAPPAGAAGSCPDPSSGAGYPHQAPEIEALLPSIVDGRPLIRWSVRGRCWLETAVGDPVSIDQFVTRFRTASNPNPADDRALVYGVAGRTVQTDPPYFVFAAARPTDQDEVSLVLALLFGGAGFKDVAGASDLSRYREQTIGGRQVYVGTPDMVDQGGHQRGRPYLYQTDQYMFVVIADADTWAREAIGQLPSR